MDDRIATGGEQRKSNLSETEGIGAFHGSYKPKSSKHWDEATPSYARKPVRSGYLAQLLKMLPLEEGDSLFDMGCGPGVISIPVAKKGHRVVSVDFSEGMLSELERSAKAGNVTGITTYKRSWEEDWDDIPSCDVALASRSLITQDPVAALLKLESKALKKVVVTTPAGQTPWMDRRLLKAAGATDPTIEAEKNFAALVSYLFSTGRRPEVRYIEYRHRMTSPSKEEAREHLERCLESYDLYSLDFLDGYLEKHLVETSDQDGFALDYERADVWGVLIWNPKKATN